MAKLTPKIAKNARVAFEKWNTWFKFNIDQYHTFFSFVLGAQWTEQEEDALKTFRKVPLQANMLATLANTWLGEQQQNTPQLQVDPGPGCNEEVAQIREMITKQIMFQPSAKSAYQSAAKQAFIGGFGAYLIDTDYTDENSWELDICYYPIKDPTRCYWDISAENENKSDSRVSGYLVTISRESFREQYGKNIEQKIAGESSLQSSEEEVALAVQPTSSPNSFAWADADSITLQHHYVRKQKNVMLYRLSDGTELNQEEMDDLIEKSQEINAQHAMTQEGMEGEGMHMPPADEEAEEGEQNIQTLWREGQPVSIKNKKSHPKYFMTHYVIAGEYTLEEQEFPASKTGVIFVDQNSYYDKAGKQVCRPFLIDAKDTQRYINYLRTQSAHILKISRYDQFMGSKKNVASNDTAAKWRDPSVQQGMLTYDVDPSGAKPERIQAPELSQSLLSQYELAKQDIYTATGLYPARVGNQGNEESGAAIDARTRQGSNVTFPSFNAINNAITAGGCVVNDMIPHVYDAERVIMLEGDDEGRKSIVVNQQMDEYGSLIKNDIRKGTYQVKLVAGPSTEGQKKEGIESLNMILQHNPQMFPLFADLYAENLPVANNMQIKNRLKTIVPPGIIEAGKTGKPPKQQQQQPDPQQQAEMMMAQLKQQELQLKQKELMLKAQAQQVDTQMQLQELEMKRAEIAARLEEQQLRYIAETHKTDTEQAMSHATNLASILTSNIHTERPHNANK